MWVLSFSVRETLLDWHDSFVGKKHRKVWMTASLCLFWSIWKESNRIVFKMSNCWFKWWKIILFLFFGGLRIKLFIDEGPLPLINFFYWLGSRWRLVRFFVSSLSFLFLPLGTSCILLVCFGFAFGCPFLLFIYKLFSVHLPIEKKMNLEPFIWEIWGTCAPWVCSFAWEVVYGKILTLHNLVRRKSFDEKLFFFF